MKISIILILALCVAMCASRASPRCNCPKTDSQVDLNLISGWKTIAPRPYCNKVEVIVALKNGRRVCLDPNGNQYRFLVNLKKQRAQNAAKIVTIAPSPSSTASVQTLQTTTTVTPAASTKE